MNETMWENISRYAFLLLVFILPLWLLPYTSFPLDFNKAFLFYAITIVAAVFWFISILQNASFKIPKSFAILAFAGIIIVWLASSLFSPNTLLSLVGLGHEVGTFFSLVILGVALVLVSVLFQSEARVMTFYSALFTSSLLVFIFQFFRAGFNVTLLPWNIFTSKISNTIGSWNEVGIFFGLIALLSLIFLELMHLSRRFKIFLFAALIASFVAVTLVNFTTVWIILGIFLLVFLVYLFSVFLVSARELGEPRPRKFVNFVVVALLIVLFFVMAKTLVGDFVSSAGLTSIEVRPAWTATWQIIKSALKENFLVGTGPNTFLYDWLKFKPVDINSTLFWSYPFQAGIGLLPSFLATTGLLGGIAWFVFLVFILFYGFKVITYSENEVIRGLLIASFLGSLYLWIFAIIYTLSFFLFSLAFLITGIFIALLCHSGKMKVIEAMFLNKPKLGFISSLVIVLLMIASVASFYLLFQKYWADYSFARGLNVFNTTGNINDAESLISRAARFDQQDRYYRALSEIGLLRIQQLTTKTDISPEDLRTQFQNLLAYSINNAQSAVRQNSLDFLNWMSLGQVYEAIIPFKIAGASEAAVNAYKKASKQAPFDPRPLFTAARVEVQIGNINSAKSFLNDSINIKGDFAPAVFLLAQLEAQQGNIKAAITRTEQTLYLTPNDIGVLFQLGLLYYQDKNFESSRLVLERTVSLNANYSNARYFLGLIYDRQGRKSDAVQQFQKIKELNPDNQEVQHILTNLEKGKSALEGISPPQPSPEKRQTPPLDETKVEKEFPKK
jgi:tetratricopeptide (TPR) repeat protein